MAGALRDPAFRDSAPYVDSLTTACPIALRAVTLGVLHGSEAEAVVRLRMLARCAGFSPGTELRFETGGQTVHIVGSSTRAVQAETCDDEMCDGGPFDELARWRFSLVVTSGMAPASELAGELEQQLAPFSTSELDAIARLNPLVARIAEEHAAQRPLALFDMVVRDHLLLEKYNLLSALVRLGLDASRCWVVRKLDATRYGERVAAQLAVDGFRIVGAEEPLDEIAAHIATDAARRPLIVVDDGGDLGLAIWRRLRHEGRQFHLLESTSKGVRTLLEAGLDGEFADVASSTVKLQLSRSIAVSCVMRFRELLRHEHLAGELCHVVGYGRLGRHVASLLEQTGTFVTVSDVRPEAREDAANDGFNVFSSPLEALTAMPHSYLFGCSGVPVVGHHEVARLRGAATLASVSSQDLRPVLTWLRARARAQPRRGVGTRYTLADGRSWTVLADGHAINLFHAEGVGELDYDPFTALLLLLVVETARVRAHGVDVERLCAEVAERQPAPSTLPRVSVTR